MPSRRSSDSPAATTPHGLLPEGQRIIGVALLTGTLLGAGAKLLGRTGPPLLLLGIGAAFWVSAGFLVARRSARGRQLLDGTVWAGASMAVYLCAWLLAYCVVFSFEQTAGFGAAWLDERIFFILTPVVSALLGLIAAASWREGRIGDACLVAPIAWSVPETIYAITQGWSFALCVALPTIALACIPLASSRHTVSRVTVLVAITSGGLVALALMRVVMGHIV